MRRRRAVGNILITHAAATALVMVLIVSHGNETLMLAALLMFVIISLVGWSAWYLIGRVMPAEEAFELGYQAGYRDGRRTGSLRMVNPRRIAG